MLKILEVDFLSKQEMNLKALHITQSFLKNLDCKIFKGIQRINFIFINDENYKISLIHLDSAIVTVKIHIDFEEFGLKSFTSILGNYIFNGLNMIFDYKEWDNNYLRLAYEQSLKEEFIAPIKISKYYYNDDRSRRTEMYIRITEGYIDLFMIIQEKIRGNKWKSYEFTINKIHLNLFLIKRYFSEIRWKGDRIEIIDLYQEIHHMIDVRNKSIEVVFKPKENDLNNLNGYVKSLNYETGEDGLYFITHC